MKETEETMVNNFSPRMHRYIEKYDGVFMAVNEMINRVYAGKKMTRLEIIGQISSGLYKAPEHVQSFVVSEIQRVQSL